MAAVLPLPDPPLAGDTLGSHQQRRDGTRADVLVYGLLAQEQPRG